MAQIPDWTSLPQPVPTPSYRRVQVDDSTAHLDETLAEVSRHCESVHLVASPSLGRHLARGRLCQTTGESFGQRRGPSGYSSVG